MGLRRFFSDSRGGAAAELALILPGIAFIVLNVTDLSVYIYSKMQVDLAAQEAVGSARMLCNTAAELPATTKCGVSTLNSTMWSAAQNTSLGSGVNLSTFGGNYFEEQPYCASAAGELVVAGTVASPSANCSAVVSGSTAQPGFYLKATANYPFSPVFPGASVAALLPATIQRTAWIRLK